MGGNIKCSRDDCPPANLHKDYSAKCGNCGDELHLPCIGIDRKMNEVLFHRNVRVFCNGCSAKSVVGSNINATAKPVVKSSSFSSAVFGTTGSFDASSAKIDSIAAMLLQVHDIVRETNEKVTSSVDSSQSYANVVKKVDELKEIATKTNARVNEKCFEKQIVSVSTDRNLSSYPRLGTPSSKRKCISSPPSVPLQPTRKFLGRKRTSGTATIANHGLGSRVDLGNGIGDTSQSRPRFTKAIYVSRMQNDVTKEKIVEYMKSQMPELNESGISLRLLLKKDVDVTTRRFISYRLACTDALYEKLIEPSFWPDHIEIGEFFEESRDRGSNNMASFPSPLAMNVRRNAHIRNSSAANDESVRDSVRIATGTPSASSKNEAQAVMETSQISHHVHPQGE